MKGGMQFQLGCKGVKGIYPSYEIHINNLSNNNPHDSIISTMHLSDKLGFSRYTILNEYFTAITNKYNDGNIPVHILTGDANVRFYDCMFGNRNNKINLFEKIRAQYIINKVYRTIHDTDGIFNIFETSGKTKNNKTMNIQQIELPEKNNKIIQLYFLIQFFLQSGLIHEYNFYSDLLNNTTNKSILSYIQKPQYIGCLSSFSFKYNKNKKKYKLNEIRLYKGNNITPSLDSNIETPNKISEKINISEHNFMGDLNNYDNNRKKYRGISTLLMNTFFAHSCISIQQIIKTITDLPDKEPILNEYSLELEQMSKFMLSYIKSKNNYICNGGGNFLDDVILINNSNINVNYVWISAIPWLLNNQHTAGSDHFPVAAYYTTTQNMQINHHLVVTANCDCGFNRASTTNFVDNLLNIINCAFLITKNKIYKSFFNIKEIKKIITFSHTHEESEIPTLQKMDYIQIALQDIGRISLDKLKHVFTEKINESEILHNEYRLKWNYMKYNRLKGNQAILTFYTF